MQSILLIQKVKMDISGVKNKSGGNSGQTILRLAGTGPQTISPVRNTIAVKQMSISRITDDRVLLHG